MTGDRPAWAPGGAPVLIGAVADLLANGALRAVRVAVVGSVDGVLASVLEDAGADVQVVADDQAPGADVEVVVDRGGEVARQLLAAGAGAWPSLRGVVDVAPAGVVGNREAAAGTRLDVPVLAAGEAASVRLAEAAGSAQAVIQAILALTNLRLPGARVAVVGDDPVARRLVVAVRDLGGRPVVAGHDPVAALEAHLGGRDVDGVAAALADADVVVVMAAERLDAMRLACLRPSTVVANGGQRPDAIDLAALKAASTGVAEVRPGVTRYLVDGERPLFVLRDGAPVVTDPEPLGGLDLTLAVAVLAVRELAHGQLPPGIHPVPDHIDDVVARAALAAAGIHLTDSQAEREAGRRQADG